MEDEQKLTKREKRVLAKEEKRKQREKEERTSSTKKYAIWLVILVILGWLGYKAYQFVTAPAPEVVAQPIEVFETDHVKGDEEATVTLMEYADFQCPACANYSPLVKMLGEDFPEGFRIVFRHYPLVSIHPNAMPSAKAAEAAGRQGKFWEMHDILFERQNDWSGDTNAEDKFLEYARELELDEDQFLADFDSPETQEKINNDLASGNRLGVNATPTFYLNGRQVAPRNYEDFKSLVEDEIRGYTLE